MVSSNVRNQKHALKQQYLGSKGENMREKSRMRASFDELSHIAERRMKKIKYC